MHEEKATWCVFLSDDSGKQMNVIYSQMLKTTALCVDIN